MKKRIFWLIVTLSVITAITTGVFTSLVHYEFYVEEAESQLKTIVKMAAMDQNGWEDYSVCEANTKAIIKDVNYDLRISVIKSDGTVVFDSFADYRTMGNHKNRPEIEDAFRTGYGERTRFSNTLSKNTYYYAVKVSDDTALRFSRQINNIRQVFTNVVPMISMALVLVIIFASVMASWLTKKIMQPIKLITSSLSDLSENNELDGIEVYEELLPFAEKIKYQKNKINEYIYEIKQERDTIGIITQNMQEGLILLDKNKNILSINTSAKQMIGNAKFDTDEHKNILELTRNLQISDNIDNAMLNLEHIVFEISKDEKYYKYFLNPVTENKSEKLTGILVLVEDITVEKRADIMRQEFSANVSHELKTPLTTINGFAEMIKEGLITDTESIQKYCGIINQEGIRLISLIEDIMRLSEIEEGQISANDTTINIGEQCIYVCDLLKMKAENKNITLNCNAVNVEMKGNKNYINELIYNLTDNAIKYNKPMGNVDVSVAKDGNKIILCVKDTGVGISQQHQKRMFERFYRVDKSRSKETGGTGLGLSIAKHIVELYKGNIELKSEENIGTEIKITFVL